MTAIAERRWSQHIKPLPPDDLAGDLIPPSHPLFGLIWINRERVSEWIRVFTPAVFQSKIFLTISSRVTPDLIPR